MKAWMVAAAAMVASATGGPLEAQPVRATEGTAVIPRLIGTVNSGNAMRFLAQVEGRTDKIVGLKVHFTPSTSDEFKKTLYLVDKDERLFVISKSTPGKDDGMEMVAPQTEAIWDHGDWALDGFYLVKSGGVHQGTTSVGLEKVSESAVILSPKFRVADQLLK